MAAMRDGKTGDRSNKSLQTVEVTKLARELTHREDFAQNGDYLGRQPEDLSDLNHFDEEYFVDQSENGPEPKIALEHH